ncbi:hypothetical protein A9310_22295 [Gordonia sp. UCD-TK1]|nr:hypothetical protein A9310_22295 [Gordonia sp. UCD-TK1]OCW87225.1 hypothetical protein A8M60_17855 [Nocardia farcinica]
MSISEVSRPRIGITLLLRRAARFFVFSVRLAPRDCLFFRLIGTDPIASIAVIGQVECWSGRRSNGPGS